VTLVPVKGADGLSYNLEFDTAAGGGLTPAAAIEGDHINQGGLTSSSSSQQLVAANSSRKKIDISNAGDSDVWLTFHASASAVAGQGRLLPGRAQGSYYTKSRVAVINESGGSNCAIGFEEF
jgi:hypothetical protein